MKEKEDDEGMTRLATRRFRCHVAAGIQSSLQASQHPDSRAFGLTKRADVVLDVARSLFAVRVDLAMMMWHLNYTEGGDTTLDVVEP